MRAVLQRVREASVTVDGKITGQIEDGLLVLAAIGENDDEAALQKMADKIVNLRIFEDAEGRMNVSLLDRGLPVLAVSQFTLYADCAKGNRPSYIEAAEPGEANRRYEEFCRELRALGHEVRTGVFGGRMMVDLVNDGPVTIILESRGRAAS